MRHRWIILQVVSVIVLSHSSSGAVYRRGVGNNNQPERKPSLSCVLFFGDGLCSFKCRLFGQGAEGHCKDKSCLCEHDGETYIEGENGFERQPKPQDLVSSRSIANAGTGVSGQRSSPSTNIEFTADENQLRLKLMTLMVYQSKGGQKVDVCEFLENNKINIEDLRRLSDKERLRNKGSQSQSSSTSESDNIGAMVLKLLPNGCPKNQSSKTETRRPIKKKTDSVIDDLSALQARIGSTPARRGYSPTHSPRSTANDNNDSRNNGKKDASEERFTINPKSLPWYPGERRGYQPKSREQNSEPNTPISSTRRVYEAPSQVPKSYPSEQHVSPSSHHSKRGGHITPKAHLYPTKRQISLKADVLPLESIRVTSPSHNKPNVPSKTLQNKKRVEKAGRFSFISPTRPDKNLKFNPQSPQHNVAPMPQFMVQPAETEILPQEPTNKPITVSAPAVSPPRRLRVPTTPRKMRRKRRTPLKIPSMQTGFKPMRVGAPMIVPSRIKPDADAKSKPKETSDEKPDSTNLGNLTEQPDAEKSQPEKLEDSNEGNVNGDSKAPGDIQHDGTEDIDLNSDHQKEETLDKGSPLKEPEEINGHLEAEHSPVNQTEQEVSPERANEPKLGDSDLSSVIAPLEPVDESNEAPKIEPESVTPEGVSDLKNPLEAEGGDSMPLAPQPAGSMTPEDERSAKEAGSDSVHQPAGNLEASNGSIEKPVSKSEAEVMPSTTPENEIKPIVEQESNMHSKTGETEVLPTETELKPFEVPQPVTEAELRNDEGDTGSKPELENEFKDNTQNGNPSQLSESANEVKPEQISAEPSPVVEEQGPQIEDPLYEVGELQADDQENKQMQLEDVGPSEHIPDPKFDTDKIAEPGTNAKVSIEPEAEPKPPSGDVPEGSDPTSQTDTNKPELADAEPENESETHEAAEPENKSETQGDAKPEYKTEIQDGDTPSHDFNDSKSGPVETVTPKADTHEDSEPETDPKPDFPNQPNAEDETPETVAPDADFVEGNHTDEFSPQVDSERAIRNEDSKAVPNETHDEEINPSIETETQINAGLEDSNPVANPDTAPKLEVQREKPTENTSDNITAPLDKTESSEEFDDSQPIPNKQPVSETMPNVGTETEAKPRIENPPEKSSPAIEILPITSESGDLGVDTKEEIPEHSKLSEEMDGSRSNSVEQTQAENKVTDVTETDTESKPDTETPFEDTNSTSEELPTSAESEKVDPANEVAEPEDSKLSEGLNDSQPDSNKQDETETKPNVGTESEIESKSVTETPSEDSFSAPETQPALAELEKVDPANVVAVPEDSKLSEGLDDSQPDSNKQDETETKPNDVTGAADTESKPVIKSSSENNNNTPEIQPITAVSENVSPNNDVAVPKDPKLSEKVEDFKSQPTHEPEEGEQVLSDYEDEDLSPEDTFNPPRMVKSSPSKPTNEPMASNSLKQVPSQVSMKPEDSKNIEGKLESKTEPTPESALQDPIKQENAPESVVGESRPNEDENKDDADVSDPEPKQEAHPETVTETVPESALKPSPEVDVKGSLEPSENDSGKESEPLNQNASPSLKSIETPKLEENPKESTVPEIEVESKQADLPKNSDSGQATEPENVEPAKVDPNNDQKLTEDFKSSGNHDESKSEPGGEPVTAAEEGEKVLEEYDDEDPNSEGISQAPSVLTDPKNETKTSNEKKTDQPQQEPDNSKKYKDSGDGAKDVNVASPPKDENLKPVLGEEVEIPAQPAGNETDQGSSKEAKDDDEIEADHKSPENMPTPPSDAKPEEPSDSPSKSIDPEPEEGEHTLEEYEDDDPNDLEDTPDAAADSNPLNPKPQEKTLPSEVKEPKRPAEVAEVPQTLKTESPKDLSHDSEPHNINDDPLVIPKTNEDSLNVESNNDSKNEVLPALKAPTENDQRHDIANENDITNASSEQNPDDLSKEESPMLENDQNLHAAPQIDDPSKNIIESPAENNKQINSESKLPEPEDDGEHVMEEYEDDDEPDHAMASKSLTFPDEKSNDDNKSANFTPISDAPSDLDGPGKQDDGMIPKTPTQSVGNDLKPEENSRNENEPRDSVTVYDAPQNSNIPSFNHDDATSPTSNDGTEPGIEPEVNSSSDNRPTDSTPVSEAQDSNSPSHVDKSATPLRSNQSAEPNSAPEETRNNDKHTPENKLSSESKDQPKDPKTVPDEKPEVDEIDDSEHVLEEYEDDDGHIDDDHPTVELAPPSPKAGKEEDATNKDIKTPAPNVNNGNTMDGTNKKAESHDQPDIPEPDEDEKVLEEFTDDEHPDVFDDESHPDSHSDDVKVIKDYIIDEVATEHEHVENK